MSQTDWSYLQHIQVIQKGSTGRLRREQSPESNKKYRNNNADPLRDEESTQWGGLINLLSLQNPQLFKS